MNRPWVGLAFTAVFAALPGGAALAAQAAATSAASFAYSQPLALARDSGNWQLSLPEAVYRHTRHAGPDDLAVWDADGRPTPLALCGPEPAATGVESPAPLSAFRLRPGAAAPHAGESFQLETAEGTRLQLAIDSSGSLQQAADAGSTYILDLHPLAGAATALLLDWQRLDKASELSLDIARSDNLQQWTALTSQRLLQAEAGQARLEQRRIEFTEPQKGYLRLTPSAPLSLLRVQALQIVPAAAPTLSWFDATPLAPAQHDFGQAFDYQSLPAAAIESARIHAPAGVSTLALRLEKLAATGASIGLLWEGVVRFGADGAALQIDWPAQAVARVRLKPTRGAQSLTTAPRLQLGYRPARLAFAAQGRAPWRLVYGAGRPPAREPWRCDELLADAGVASLSGNEQTLGGEAAYALPVAAPPWSRWGLWALLLAGAALVIAMAWKTLRESQGR